jgi:hypothetical protein
MDDRHFSHITKLGVFTVCVHLVRYSQLQSSLFITLLLIQQAQQVLAQQVHDYTLIFCCVSKR